MVNFLPHIFLREINTFFSPLEIFIKLECTTVIIHSLVKQVLGQIDLKKRKIFRETTNFHKFFPWNTSALSQRILGSSLMRMASSHDFLVVAVSSPPFSWQWHNLSYPWKRTFSIWKKIWKYTSTYKNTNTVWKFYDFPVTVW